MMRYPDSTGIMLRKIRATMANSTLLFFRRQVLGKAHKNVVFRPSESRFEYPNGSVLVYGGMANDEQREHIRSVGALGGVDIAWMEEATQFDEEDYNEVLARMRGMAAPWRQIILTTNPDAPSHWINVRLIIGREASVHYSGAGDNPYNPEDYKGSLRRLTGAQRERLLNGLWKVGSGVIIDTWLDVYNEATGGDGGGNVTARAEYVPGGGPVVWAIDDGYTGRQDENTGIYLARSHPRAFLIAQLRENGTISIIDEDLAIHTLLEEQVARVEAKCQAAGYPKPAYIVHDKSAQSLAGYMMDRGYDTTFEQVSVEESLKELRDWVGADKNGIRKVLVHPRCFYLRYQMQTYSYNEKGLIIKDHDDCIDALRYLVWCLAYGMGSITVDVVSYSDVS